MAFVNGARAEAPPGTVEEFPLLLGGHAQLGTLAAGPEGSLWLTENVDHVGILGWIRRFSQSGVVTGEFSIPTAQQNGSNPDLPLRTFPNGLARGPDGNMWFADDGRNAEGRNLIGQITPAGTVREYPIPSKPPVTPPEDVEGPRVIAAGVEADVWFTDEREDEAGHSFIGRITHTGHITEFPVPTGSGVDVPTHSAPRGIAMGADGNMWFTDQGTNDKGQELIGRLAPSGAITEFPIPAVHAEPGSIALGADGNMWFVEAGVDRIGRITPTGEIKEFEALPGGGEPVGLALGPDGNMWFTGGYPTPTIAWMTPSGSVREIPKALLGNALPSEIIAGSDGNLWFTDYRTAGASGGLIFELYGFIGRLITPYPPANIEVPLVSGQAVEGGKLIASEGSWTHYPTNLAYQWQRCDVSGLNCEDIPAGLEAAYVAEASDVGHALRVAVTAANIAGSASSTSRSSPVVQGLPSPLVPPPPRPLVLESSPLLGATLTWGFRWSRKYTIVKSLLVNDMPVGGFVDVLCKGRGCRFAHRRVVVTVRRLCHTHRCAAVHAVRSSGELNLATMFHARRLRPGTRLTVSLVEDGWIGKSYMFDVRKNQVPSSLTTCLTPGSVSVSHVC